LGGKKRERAGRREIAAVFWEADQWEERSDKEEEEHVRKQKQKQKQKHKLKQKQKQKQRA